MHSHRHCACGVCGCICVCRELYSNKPRAMCSSIKTKLVWILCVLGSWIFFLFLFIPMAFLLNILCLITTHPYECPKGKVKGLGAGVSAETLMSQGIRPLRGEKYVLSLLLVVDAMPLWHVWAGNPVP